MGYSLEGKLLEACSCATPCRCWIGDGPAGGKCDALLAYCYERGQINGVDVGGLTLALAAKVPGAVRQGNWKVVVYLDARATPEQKEMLLGAHTGRFGGPLADLAPLIGEVLGVYDLPIESRLGEGRGTIAVGDAIRAEVQPYADAQGRPTRPVDTVFSMTPGSPAYVGRALSFRMNIPQHGFVWEFNGSNAVLGEFRFEG